MIYIKKSSENALKKWDDLSIRILYDIANEIKNFVPIKGKFIHIYI